MKVLFILAVVCASFALGADVKAEPLPLEPADDAKPKTTTTTSTVAPETTTTAKPSSTDAPTTTAAPPTTAPPTTAAPVTTTSAPASTTPAPSDGRGHWMVRDGNLTCIMAVMGVSAKVAYPLQTANKSAEVTVSVPVSAEAKGSCDPNTQFISIDWPGNNLKVTFGKNTTTNVYYISHVTLSLAFDNKTFPNVSSEWLNTTQSFDSSSLEFQTAVNQSYRCSREEMLPLTLAHANKSDVVLVLDNVQLQAFHEKDGEGFGDAHECEPDTPDIVPIAVGCALAALVLLVLVAYLVGRRRSQARGYLSM